jgi:V/A-type H+-transporting ATPase subunit I
MIEKMHKLYLIINASSLSSTLDSLQNLGIIHLSTKPLPESIGQEFANKQRRIQNFLKYFAKYPPSLEKVGDPEIILTRFEEARKELAHLAIDLKKLEKEDKELLPWGNFDLKLITTLREKIDLKFYTLSAKTFKNTDFKDYHVTVINDQGPLHIMVASTGKIDLPLSEVVLVDNSYKRTELASKIDQTKKGLDELAGFSLFLRRQFIKTTNDLNFSLVEQSLDSHYDAFYSLSGWIPDGNVIEVTNFLNNLGDMAYIISDDLDELPPVKLKNRPWFRIFEPITKLFDLPNYNELDLTPLFAPFFVLFFGLCFGDAFYGLILLLVSVVGLFKSKKLTPFFAVGAIFGLSTTICGLLTGSFLGFPLFELETAGLPRVFVLLQRFFQQVFGGFARFDSNAIFYMALLIGLFQILFGMLTNMVNKIYQEKNILAGLAPLGWFILFSSLSILYLSTKDPALQNDFFIKEIVRTVGNNIDVIEKINIGRIIIATCNQIPKNYIYTAIGIAVFFILFFNDIKANIFSRFGKGLWALYGITGKLGDLLSYIRLFALGLSGATLGLVINRMSGGLLDLPPVLGHLLFIILMTLGHGLNFALNILGSFVHPLRLTFIEFYGNAGFSGGGKTYKPFTKNKE